MNIEKSTMDEIMAQFQNSLNDRKKEIEKRQQEFYKKYPELEKIDHDIAFAGVRTASKIAGQKQTIDEVATDLIKTLEDLKNKRELILKENNITDDYFNIPYSCPVCQDTGFVGGARCSCFNKKLAKYVFNMSNINTSQKTNNFKNFDFSYYSRKADASTNISPYDNIKSVTGICKNFCQNFSTINDNLYIYGGTGLGKTYLASCVAGELIEKGYTVLYQTAYKTFSFLEDYKFGRLDRDTNKILYNLIYECDLLIIDDLGTEFITQFSQAAFFDILNSRITCGKKMIISTNLSISDLANTYSTRVSSRIAGDFVLLKLFGDDIRMKLKK